MMNMKLSLLMFGAVFSLLGCSGGEKQSQALEKTQVVEGAGKSVPKTVTITGAGASFPQPVYAQWAQAYQEATGNQVNYQSIGSSGGIKQIVAKTVDFGASDAPLTKEELDKEGLIQFPTVVGGVVPIVNIEGIEAGQVVLSGEVLAKIYLGQITRWNDASIVALNQGVNLPDAAITTVFRSDGSGTTFNFTNYLSQVSADWQKEVGVSKAVKWPTTATGAAGKGNEGVSAFVGKIKNSIGYVEYAYAKQNKMAHTALINRAGNVVQPSQAAFAAAAETDWKSAPGFHLVLTNQGNDQAWPIVSATFILVHTHPENPERLRSALAFFDWAYASGDDYASRLDYVPLTENTKNLMRESWLQVVNQNGEPLMKK